MTTMQTVASSASVTLYPSETAGLENGKIYEISRKLPSGRWTKPRIAVFKKALPGRSLYFGKWIVVGRITPVYHDEKVKVVRRVSKK